MLFRVPRRLAFALFLGLALSCSPWGRAPAVLAFDAGDGTPTATPTVTETPPAVDPPALPTVTPTATPTETAVPAPEMLELLVGFYSPLPGEGPLPPVIGWQPETTPELAKLGIALLRVPVHQSEQVIAALREDSSVRYVEVNNTVQALETIPNDPAWVNQYNMTAIRAPQGWDLDTGSLAIAIAIIDSGVDLTHPDLAGKLLPGYDFVDKDEIPQDVYGHGTHAAGLAAAVSNNGTGMAGVSWGARILPVRVLDASGGGTYADVAAGIIWATDHYARVINLSLGGSSPSQVLSDAVDYAASRGVLLVAAAGNTGGGVLYPAAYPAVIAVAATDSANQRAFFSSYGPAIDLAAPGASIYSLNIGGGYIYRSGTSMAAPHVAGLASILLGRPGADAALARAWMEASALDIDAPGWDVFTGAGLIQVDAALRAAIPPTATPTSTLLPVDTVTLTPGEVFPGGATPTRTLIPIGGVNITPAPRFTGTMTPSLGALPGDATVVPSPTQAVVTLPPAVASITPQPGAPDAEVSSQSVGGGMSSWLLCGGMLVILGGLLLLAALRRISAR